MAEQSPSFQFDDIPLDEARRMDPVLYQALTGKIQSLAHTTPSRRLSPDT
jgi:hypothetical protein